MKSVIETSGIATSGYGPRKIIVEFWSAAWMSDELQFVAYYDSKSTAEVSDKLKFGGHSNRSLCAGHTPKERPVYTIADQMAAKLYIDAFKVQASACRLGYRQPEG